MAKALPIKSTHSAMDPAQRNTLAGYGFKTKERKPLLKSEIG